MFGFLHSIGKGDDAHYEGLNYMRYRSLLLLLAEGIHSDDYANLNALNYVHDNEARSLKLDLYLLP